MGCDANRTSGQGLWSTLWAVVSKKFPRHDEKTIPSVYPDTTHHDVVDRSPKPKHLPRKSTVRMDELTRISAPSHPVSCVVKGPPQDAARATHARDGRRTVTRRLTSAEYKCITIPSLEALHLLRPGGRAKRARPLLILEPPQKTTIRMTSHVLGCT